MANKKHLTHAPITEALIDIRIDPIKDFSIDTLSEIKERIGESYPQYERKNSFEGKIEIKPADQQVSQTILETGLFGYFFKSADSLNIAQFRVDGYTFNRLKPYTSWSTIFSEAKSLWNVYAQVIHPETVTRVAVRYINHLKLPLPVSKELSQYLTVPPRLPSELPTSISSFLTKMSLVYEQEEIRADLVQVIEPNAPSQFVAVIFDIDVYKRVKFRPDDPQMWQIFSDLREIKNRIFFSHITEDTVRLFE